MTASGTAADEAETRQGWDDTADPPVVPRRYPWRWVCAGGVVLALAWMAWVLATTETMEWNVVGEYLFSSEVLAGVKGTVVMTVLSMALGMVLGTLVAVMRLSPNPVLTGVASLYQWFFRGTPTLVQLIFWFNLSSIFPGFEVGVGALGFDVDTNRVMTPFLAALLGLGLNFAAYYSEIVRAGILSVDEGQSDAATAYGLSRFRTLRHIVLPQAMRVIIPPTGNELIGMLKFTSLASVVSYSELLRSASDVYNRTYQVIPLLVVAAIWYLFMTTVLSTGQHFLEKRFARGAQRATTSTLAERILTDVRGRWAKRR
ncbi:amino acid ABC transporter permease [Streptomyces sp. MMCC 100]|uniref:amino acid ABC transporter permease n=1 Tax=Streptomyces sp. MMCC 100 TaxID=3163555 RepID=UPI0035964E4D